MAMLFIVEMIWQPISERGKTNDNKFQNFIVLQKYMSTVKRCLEFVVKAQEKKSQRNKRAPLHWDDVLVNQFDSVIDVLSKIAVKEMEE